MKYKYAVYISIGYFKDFRPFVTYEEAKAYYDSMGAEAGEVILLEYKQTKEVE